MVFKKLMRSKPSHLIFGGVVVVVAGMLLWNFTKNMEGFETSLANTNVATRNFTPAQNNLLNNLEPLIEHLFVLFDQNSNNIEEYLKLPPAEQSAIVQYILAKYKPNIDKAQKTIMEKVDAAKNIKK